MHIRVGLLLTCLAPLTSGCGASRLRVESDTTWEGSIDQVGDVAGRANQQFDLSNTTGQVCWTFHKRTSLGTLRVYVDDQTWFGLGAKVDGDMTTTEPGGTVQGCSG